MRLSLWIASLWPGFARAWVQGRWDGLILGAAFAAALNTGLVATFAWRDGQSAAMAGTIAAAAWVLVLGLWTLGAVWARQEWRQSKGGLAPGDSKHDEHLGQAELGQAQHEYLKGHWLEAETLAAALIAKWPSDVAARLLLASIERRTRRWNEATTRLVELRSDPAAAAWRFEIDAELNQIDELRTATNEKERKAA